MDKLRQIWEKLFTNLSISYIDLVYKTSKVIIKGNPDLLQSENEEKFILGFWHGESYCFFPVLRGSKLYVITTINRRGDYITNICNYFGYSPLRISDESTSGNSLFKIRKKINGIDRANVAISLDGPLGPYHVPKDFAYMTALISKRRIMPVSINVHRKKQLMSRWDKYTIPFPFNKIEIYFHEPMAIAKGEVILIKEKMADIMENGSSLTP